MPSRHRSLLPREHGAYAQLAAPLAAALILLPPTISAILLALAASCAFIANESLLVLLGHRGRRMKEAHEHHARVRLTWLGALAVASGALGLLCAGRSVIFAAALASLPAVALIVLAYRRAQHSLPGELVAAVALPGVSMPVAVASGLAFAEAAALWLAWSVGYVASTIAVHRVLARHRHAATTVDWIIAVVFALMTAATVFLWDSVRVARVSLPFLAFTALVVAHPPRATRLRAIGVALVAVSLTALALATTAP